MVNQSAGKMPDTTPLKSGVSLGWGGWFDVYVIPDKVASLFTVIFFSSHRRVSLKIITSEYVMGILLNGLKNYSKYRIKQK